MNSKSLRELSGEIVIHKRLDRATGLLLELGG